LTIEDRTRKESESFRLILFAVCASIFMANLDTTIVNISLPTNSKAKSHLFAPMMPLAL